MVLFSKTNCFANITLFSWKVCLESGPIYVMEAPFLITVLSLPFDFLVRFAYATHTNLKVVFYGLRLVFSTFASWLQLPSPLASFSPLTKYSFFFSPLNAVESPPDPKLFLPVD